MSGKEQLRVAERNGKPTIDNPNKSIGDNFLIQIVDEEPRPNHLMPN